MVERYLRDASKVYQVQDRRRLFIIGEKRLVANIQKQLAELVHSKHHGTDQLRLTEDTAADNSARGCTKYIS